MHRIIISIPLPLYRTVVMMIIWMISLSIGKAATVMMRDPSAASAVAAVAGEEIVSPLADEVARGIAAAVAAAAGVGAEVAVEAVSATVEVADGPHIAVSDPDRLVLAIAILILVMTESDRVDPALPARVARPSSRAAVPPPPCSRTSTAAEPSGLSLIRSKFSHLPRNSSVAEMWISMPVASRMRW